MTSPLPLALRNVARRVDRDVTEVRSDRQALLAASVIRSARAQRLGYPATR